MGGALDRELGKSWVLNRIIPSHLSKSCLKQTNNVLQLYNPKYETLIETDSSGYGIGVVFMQYKNPNDEWHPCHYVSRTLNNAEKNYSNIEREALSVVFVCEKFRKFLLGSYFTIRNYHKPLEKNV